MGGKRRQNWVDRGEGPEPTMRRVLAHFLHYAPDAEAALLDEAVVTILGMVDADASEVLVSGYLGTLEDRVGRERSPGAARRLVAIAVWHIGKVARVREAAIRALVDAHRAPPPPPSVSLSDWLAERLLTAEEQEARRRGA